MAYVPGAPYRPQDSGELSVMFHGLEGSKGNGKSKTNKVSIKKNTFAVDGSSIKVDSWKMQDWDYKKEGLPTYARGLFTCKDRKGKPQIAVRGYDKFFNQGEVRETEWANIRKNTRGPYELSVKENGCIIFISGLEDGNLIVCSKHSTGSRADVEVSHAKAGEIWVNRHLQSVGKTKEQLAMTLRNMNATAVAELCDDAFEEHVLAYSPESAGLYLHGINLNLPEFATYPHHIVDKFADDWGFKKTTYITKDHINDVQTFLDGVAETGNYDGRDTEGFVVRCQSKANTGEWHDWFFKYKFEEPYLMYRQWRECTKAVIAGKEPKYKKHKKITEDYILFARRQLHANPSLAKMYQANHGIIKMRDDFLAYRGLKGSDIIRQEAAEGEVSNDAVTKDIVLVPVASIGCGKTTVALALRKLFNWGHVQNDNIIAKKGKPQAFATACSSCLVADPVMIADRNNHQRRERKQLIEDVSRIVPGVRFVALQYVHERGNYDAIRAATQERVFSRGDNHQTIHVGTKGRQEVVGIMEGFLHRFEPVDQESSPDDGFDTVINLDATSSSRQNLETVITQLYTEYPALFGDREMPTSEEMDLAIDAALNDYTVDIKHEIKSSSNKPARAANNGQMQPAASPKPKVRKVEYFAVQVPSNRVNAILDAVFRDTPPEVGQMYRTLVQQRRVQPAFHVTLIHRVQAAQHHAEWTRLNKLQDAATPMPFSTPTYPAFGRSKVRFERLVWNKRVMAFVVRLSPAEGSTEQFSTVNETAHVTVGTAEAYIKPKEANDLLVNWLQTGSGGETGIMEIAVKGTVEIEGDVRGVVSR